MTTDETKRKLIAVVQKVDKRGLSYKNDDGFACVRSCRARFRGQRSHSFTPEPSRWQNRRIILDLKDEMHSLAVDRPRTLS
jgi:hypothetical protein